LSRADKPSFVVSGHLSRPKVTSWLQRSTGNCDGQPQNVPSILHQVGFTERSSRHAAGELLPRLSILTPEKFRCGLFLLHFPWSRLHRVLPGTLPYGARTFLVGKTPRDHLARSKFILLSDRECVRNSHIQWRARRPARGSEPARRWPYCSRNTVRR
jgi:hypothetical protein